MAAKNILVDYYNILEVSPKARSSVIKAAYKTLMQEYHPDVSGETRVAMSLNEAKEILLDDKKRKDYDDKKFNLEGKIVGNYRILDKIAEGGFGCTYRGEQIHLRAPVCIKHGHYISPQDEELLLKEAASIWDLRHFGLPAMRDILKLEDGSPALVMSYIPGPTISHIIKKVEGLDPEHVAWITERVLNVLKYLHFNGVVHGDVKPQNIIVQPETHNIVLVDFGLSTIRPSSDSKVEGYTPFFASPEQIARRPLIPESDLYSLGATMIYALGGDVAKQKVPSDTPDAMCAFIKKLLIRDPLSRPSWDKEDLCKTIQDIRQKSFGRIYSGLKKIPGV